MKNSLFILAVLSLVVTMGCEGPEGPTGPRGKDGVDGNANVNVINGYVDPAQWVLATAGFYFVEINDAYITQDIVTYGSVFVYYSVNSTDWLLLPFTTIVDASNFYLMDALYFVGKVQIRYRHSNPSLTVAPQTRRYFKIIVIESTYLGKISNGTIKWNDYNDVKLKLNLQE